MQNAHITEFGHKDTMVLTVNTGKVIGVTYSIFHSSGQVADWIVLFKIEDRGADNSSINSLAILQGK